MGVVFSIQRFSLFDGPGVRTVVFLKGCPLSCVWCHNPEGLSPSPQVMYDATRCIGCGECVRACPVKAHGWQNGQHSFDRLTCVSCGECAKVCCTGSLAMAGQDMGVEDVMDVVLKDASLYAESGGGMTLSGGEPLSQGEFALSLLACAKEQGIHTCVETCGHVPTQTMMQATEVTDLFYFDYKATGNDMHKALTGVSQERILENLALLDRMGADVVLRCPIVPGMNDTHAHIQGIGDVAGKYACIGQVHLMPYHALGGSKAEKLGMTNIYEGEVPHRAVLEAYAQTISAISNKPCVIN